MIGYGIANNRLNLVKNDPAVWIQNTFLFVFGYSGNSVLKTKTNSNIEWLNNLSFIVYQPPFAVVVNGSNIAVKIKYDLVIERQYCFSGSVNKTPLAIFLNSGQVIGKISCIF